MSDSYDSLFGGGRSATFPTKGTSYSGTILSAPREVQQRDFKTKDPKFYKDGDPMMQTVIEVQTNQRDPEDDSDDGVRLVYAKGQMLAALRVALREAKIRSRQALVGATFTVTFVKQEKPERRGEDGQKIYEVKVTPGDPDTAREDGKDPWDE
jgi:hypothetical protein